MTVEKLTFEVQPEAKGERLDSYLSIQLQLARSAVQRLCEQGMVLTDGKALGKNYRLRGNEIIEYMLPQPEEEQLQLVAERLPLDIVYEDAHVIVINKAKGMLVHPTPAQSDGTLAAALLSHCGESLRDVGEAHRPGIVHRIDRETSGLLIAAKTAAAYDHLTRQIAVHNVKREYMAIVHGTVKKDGTVDAAIGRGRTNRTRMFVTQDGREAVTHYRVEQLLDGFTLCRLQLETGRTHQIRVHMEHIGHPVAGDNIYGPTLTKLTKQLKGQCLHAAKLGFVHPDTDEYMELKCDLPDYFNKFLKRVSMEDY